MSCPCFSDRVLNWYILPNALMFSPGNALWITSFLGFGLRILGPRVLSLPLALESLAIYLFFFKINRKKIHPLFHAQKKLPLLLWHISSQFLFVCIESFASLFNPVCVFVHLLNVTVSMYYLYNHKIWGKDKGGSLKSIFVVHCFSQNYLWKVILQI